MIRVYFVFEDPNDEAEVNLSFIDVPTQDPGKAFERVENAAESGELWKNVFPDEREHPYALIKDKMRYLDISTLPHEHSADTVLASGGVLILP
ncbi:MAG TPA: hypothetical protein VFA71_05085 [Terriglobales bacterium]|nr:hypothetical protein [Terriglobales bacterium]